MILGFVLRLRGQDRVVLLRLHCDHKDVGSNSAATGTRNENWMLGRSPAQKVLQYFSKI